MKSFCICNSSGVLAIRRLRNIDARIVRRQVRLSASNCNNKKSEAILTLNSAFMQSIVEDSPDGKLHILVDKLNQRHMSSLLTIHYYKHIPNRFNAIIAGTDLFILSPEILFCTLAQILSWATLFLWGLEICGTYSIDPNDARGFTTNKRPISSAKAIRKSAEYFSNITPPMCAFKSFLEVASLLCNGSASPQESRLYVLLCGPRKYGCYGATGFKFNQRVDLTYEGKNIAYQEFIVVDLCNYETKVAVEYESKLFHASIDQSQKDKRRRMALEANGWKTFSILPEHLNNPAAFETIFKDILKACGQNYRIRGKKFYAKQQETLKTLNHPFNKSSKLKYYN